MFIVKLLLKNKKVWDDFCNSLVESVQKAERIWRREKEGVIKKDWVINRIMETLPIKSKIKRWLIKRFLARFLDNLIKELNKALGKNWGGKIIDLKERIEKRL
jgi:hypothetical protein